MANNTLLASDNFSSGSLAAGWALLSGGTNTSAVVVGTPNVAQPRATSETDGQVWMGATWPNDQCSEVTVQTLTSETGTFINLAARWQQPTTSGYNAQVGNSFVTLRRIDSGTATNITSSVAITVASGDVLSFQAAGSVLSFYQNGKRIVYVGDAAYQNGFPGFYSSSSVAVAHVQVSSWRGYSSVQQDGVWARQGVVLAPNVTDFSSSGFGVYEATILLDINPQILTQYSHVFKAWFSGGPGTGGQSIYYAESPDGKVWTRNATAIIANFSAVGAIKDGSGIYHIYTQPSGSPGTGTIAHYTSADGLTDWTQVSANVLSQGTTGAWDSTTIYPIKPIIIIDGTWYGLYGANNGAGNPFKVGLVTSPDGNTWTKSASNPVLAGPTSTSSIYPYCASANVGGTWYVWFQVGPWANQGSTDLDPNGVARYSTLNFTSWIGPIASAQHSQMYEAVNLPTANSQPVGGVAPYGIFTFGGQTYLFLGASQGDNVKPADAQIGLAIAPTTLTNLVVYPENATIQTQTDPFTRSAGGLGANWATPGGGFAALKIASSGLVEPGTLSTTCAAAYTGTSFPANQYSEITVASLVSNGFLSPMVLVNPTTGSGYYVGINSTAGTQKYTADIIYYDGSANHILGPSVGINVHIGDVLRLSSFILSGVGPVLSFFQSNRLITQIADVANHATSGSPGFALSESSAGQTQISLWAGGNANVIPNYPSSNTASFVQAHRDFVNKRGLRHS